MAVVAVVLFSKVFDRCAFFGRQQAHDTGQKPGHGDMCLVLLRVPCCTGGAYAVVRNGVNIGLIAFTTIPACGQIVLVVVVVVTS